jgi:hypothetical protein
MRAFSAAGNAAGFGDMAEQAEIGKVETHCRAPYFALREIRL